MSIKLNKQAQAKQPAKIKGFIICAGLVGAVIAALYPVYFYPKMHISDYRKCPSRYHLTVSDDRLSFSMIIEEIQKQTRKGIKQEDIQPGNMNVWRDPFGRK